MRVSDSVCWPLGSLNRPPQVSVNCEDAQRLAKCTDGTVEAVADADVSGVGDETSGLWLADGVTKPVADGLSRMPAAGDPVQPALTMATAAAAQTARERESMA